MTAKELFEDFLIVFARELAVEDVENQRNALSNPHEFVDELKSCFWNELTKAFNDYEELYKDEMYYRYDLQESLIINIAILQDHIEEYVSIEEAISEYLTDTYDFCVNGFEYVVENNIVKVSNIDWNYSF